MTGPRRARVLAVARPTFDTDAAEGLRSAALTALTELGLPVDGGAQLVMTPADVTLAVAEHPMGAGNDLDVLVCASFCDAEAAVAFFSGPEPTVNAALPPVVLWSFPEPGQPGERLLLNSLCGANLAAHALRHRGRRVRHVHGHPADPGVRAALAAVADVGAGAAGGGAAPVAAASGAGTGAPLVEAAAPVVEAAAPLVEAAAPVDLAAARTALAALAGTRIGLIGEAPPGFTPCEEPPGILGPLFGVEVDRLPLPDLFTRIAAVAADRRAAEHAAALAAQPSLARVPEGEALTVAATTVALADYQAETGCRALAVRCWPDFAVDLGACPCSALSRLADRGTPTACERDVLGTLTLLVLAQLGAEPAHIVDTVEFDQAAGLIRLWHCGSAPTALAADPHDAPQWLHCNRRLGVAGNFPLRPGPVILARFDTNPDAPPGAPRLRLLLGSGEAIPADNRFQGTTATVRVADPAAMIDTMITGGHPHHTVVAWRDVRPGLRGVAALLGIDVVDL